MIIVGHRGASGAEPENTLISFARALDYDSSENEIELDVWLTKDGHVMVMHDETIDRTTNGHGRVADLTLAALRQFRCAKDESIPMLYEVLKMMRSQLVFFNIEIKDPTCVEHVAALVRNFADEKRTCILSFVPRVLREARKLGLKVGLDFEEKVKKNLAAAGRLKAMRIWPRKDLVTKWLVQRAHKKGLQVVPWTVNETEEMIRLADLGVDGICTDYPERAAAMFKKPR